MAYLGLNELLFQPWMLYPFREVLRLQIGARIDSHRAFFEALATEWDALQPPQRHARLQQLLSSFDSVLRDAKNILEVGTGTGALLPLVRERAPLARLIAIDLAHAMLTRAQQRKTSATFVQADVQTLPFRTANFNVVVCHSSFPHFHDKLAALNEIKRALKSGGCVIILHDIGRAQVNAIHQSAHSVVIHHDLLPDGEEMRVLLSSAGFVEIDIEDAADRYIAMAHAAQA